MFIGESRTTQLDEQVRDVWSGEHGLQQRHHACQYGREAQTDMLGTATGARQ